MLELSDFLQIDGQKLWLESVPEPQSLLSTIHAMYRKENQAVFQTTFPLISCILARIAVLPASSCEAERLFSAMKRVKCNLRNHLTTCHLDPSATNFH